MLTPPLFSAGFEPAVSHGRNEVGHALTPASRPEISRPAPFESPPDGHVNRGHNINKYSMGVHFFYERGVKSAYMLGDMQSLLFTESVKSYP